MISLNGWLNIVSILHLIIIRLYAEGKYSCTPASVGVFFYKRTCAGSAKIALIAIDRAGSALAAMYFVMPENEDVYQKFLAQLSQIKKQMIETFPEAMSFKGRGLMTDFFML